MSEPTAPEPQDDPDRECDDTPKLTADEWAYVQAVTEGGDA